MAKALVIKGASYSVNKVATISFDEVVPCTGISLATDSITISNSDPVTVAYTVTPADTTDSVSWASSNSSVATVINGVITPVASGSCTITATCGSYSASASVTVSLPVVREYSWGYGSVTSNHISLNSNKSRVSIFATGAQKATYGVWNPDVGTLYPILIPTNATAIKVSCDPTKTSMIYDYSECLYIEWLKNEPCPDSGFTEYAYYLSRTRDNLRTSGVVTAQIPAGAESVFTSLRMASTYTDSDDPATVAETLGLTIEFI